MANSNRNKSVSDIPLFSANLQVDVAGRGVIPGSGMRAQAEVFGEMASFSKDISDAAGEIYGQEQVNKAKRGEISEADLPSPYTTIGKNVRNAYAESQAIKTNIEISNRIKEITENEKLSENAMQEALVNSADNMIANNIPELTDTIRNNFAGAGVSAIYNVSKQRLAKQREVQAASLLDSQEYWEREYQQAYVASERNRIKNDELAKQMEAGPIDQEAYTQAITGIDSTADTRLAVAKANLVSTLNGRVGIGKITSQQAEIAMKKLALKARDDFLANLAVDKGITILDNAKQLTFDEKLSIAQKAANYSGLLNNERDRVDREQREAQAQQITSAVQTAKNMAIQGDYDGAREIANKLSIQNESLGSKDVMSQVDSLVEDINFIAAAGGTPSPEVFDEYKRSVQLGQFGTIDDVIQDLKFTGRSLNREEINDLSKTIDDLPDTKLSGAGFESVKDLIKLRLPDDPEGPSLQDRLINGAKTSKRQRVIEQARNDIADGLISGTLDGTLATLPQQRDYVEAQIKTSKKIIYSDEIKLLRSAGLTKDSTPKEIKAFVSRRYGSKQNASGTASPVEKQKFSELIKAQAAIKDLED